MRKLRVECRLNAHELIMINSKDIEKIVKERFARQLADLLIREMTLTESMDCMSMSKVVTGEIVLADTEDIKLLVEAEKFINNMKEDN